MTLLVRAFLVWLVLMAAEVGHGILRNGLLTPVLGDRRARQVSVFTGTLLFLLLTCVFIPWIPADTVAVLLGVGSFWVVLTMLFEFGFGRLVLHMPMKQILADYDLRNGGLMPLGLLAMLFIPLLASVIR